MISKPTNDVIKQYIESLLTDEVCESKTIEYKQILPEGNDDAKRKFLAQISSFANTSGGDLLFGIEESEGKPKAILGLKDFSEDRDTLRLEEIIRNGLAPRLAGVQFRAISGFVNGPVLLVSIPHSFIGPHRLTFKNDSRFFARNSRGKYEMDVHELKAAFAVSETLGQKMRQFVAERLAKIRAGEGPIPLRMISGHTDARLILHVLPLRSFSFPAIGHPLPALEISKLPEPIDMRVGLLADPRYNVDGIVVGIHDFSYCQFFRFDGIEAVSARLVHESTGYAKKSQCLLPDYEVRAINGITAYLKFLRHREVPPPILVTLSMTGVRGAVMGRWVPGMSMIEPVSNQQISHDSLLPPEAIIESYDDDLPRAMHGTFDVVWNAGGQAGSPNYDRDGNWKPRL